MRFQYSTVNPSQDEFDALPRLPLRLRYDDHVIDVIGLVDSGATVNVLPYEVGFQLGAIWNDGKAIIRLAGNLGSQLAMPLIVQAEVASFSPVRLAFAWVQSEGAPLILGQTNFFMEFDVCFYRRELEFEIKPRA